MTEQVDAQLQVVRKLEEKERLLQGTINAAERELSLRTQALDMNKRKVTYREVTMSRNCRVKLKQGELLLNCCESKQRLLSLSHRLRNLRSCQRT